MPIFNLTDKLIFPPPRLAEDNGLLAIGGDLSKARLLLAYSMGIFPWYSEGDPILWWSTDPRLVLFPEDLKVSRSLNQTLEKESLILLSIQPSKRLSEIALQFILKIMAGHG